MTITPPSAQSPLAIGRALGSAGHKLDGASESLSAADILSFQDWGSLDAVISGGATLAGTSLSLATDVADHILA
ncbi:MAG: hypothetical protein AAGK23_09180 [Pseudomonadota bacterium]